MTFIKEKVKTSVKADRNRILVMAMLEWDELTYGQLVMERAEAYLHLQCGPDVYGVEMLMQHKLFWIWWRNLWFKRDTDFVKECVGETNVCSLRQYYLFIHKAERLHFKPHRIVIEKSYMDMVQQIIKEARV